MPKPHETRLFKPHSRTHGMEFRFCSLLEHLNINDPTCSHSDPYLRLGLITKHVTVLRCTNLKHDFLLPITITIAITLSIDSFN
jgi:hypothetical protein